MNSGRASDTQFDTRFSGYSPSILAPPTGAFRKALGRLKAHEAAAVVAVVMAPVAIAVLAAF